MPRSKTGHRLNEKRLETMINEQGNTIYNLSVTQKGHRIFTHSKESNETLRDIRSITKSVLSILVGMAIDLGFIESLNTPVQHYFPLAPKDLKIEDLLLMKSGYDIEDRELNHRLIKSLNWVEDILNVGRAKEKRFSYKGIDYHLLSAIITKASGMNASRLAELYLFSPLNIERFIWLEDPQGNSVGSTGLKLSHGSLEKLAKLYLDKGIWEGKRIVSSRWVSRSTRKKIDTGLPYGFYGYGFWVKEYGDKPTYKALGTGGQQILNCPEENLSIVITANTQIHSHRKTEELTKEILDSIK